MALAALELANAVVANDAAALEAACLLGLVPAVTRYCFSAWPTPLRAQAATFVHSLCHTSLATARMFVACQVPPRDTPRRPQPQVLLLDPWEPSSCMPCVVAMRTRPRHVLIALRLLAQRGAMKAAPHSVHEGC